MRIQINHIGFNNNKGRTKALPSHQQRNHTHLHAATNIQDHRGHFQTTFKVQLIPEHPSNPQLPLTLFFYRSSKVTPKSAKIGDFTNQSNFPMTANMIAAWVKRRRIGWNTNAHFL